MSNEIMAYDFDGVVSIGITPASKNDLIITGRCVDEIDEVLPILKERGISNRVIFNPMLLAERGNHTVEARMHSAMHKVRSIKNLYEVGVRVTRFFEDDPIQLDRMKQELLYLPVEFVHVQSDLVEK